MSEHKSGFVNILGKPNVGKSTLLNAMIGEKLSIITHKPQTTRHRIIAILNEDNYQIVFSDTPGYIDQPAYKMQHAMNGFALSTFEDADILLLMTDASDDPGIDESLLNRIMNLEVPKYLLINKIDLVTQETVQQRIAWWESRIKFNETIAISAINGLGISYLIEKIVLDLPEGPPYYPKDQFTDRTERFFVSEIIREKILELYHEEIPYSCEVNVMEFKEGTARNGPIVRISAEIIVARNTQKSILIGKGGAAIKQLGIAAREGIQSFLDSPVFLELFVKVKENWRDDDRSLKSYGYLH